MLKASEQLSLGALATETSAKQNFDSTVDDNTFLLSVEAVYSLEAHTGGEGPIVVGIAHGDYTAAEITEWFAATGSWDRSDKIAQERQRRKIRQVGQFEGGSVNEVLNEGRAIKTTLKFAVEDGQTLALWSISLHGSTLTTGTIVHCTGKVWAGR